MPYKSVYSLYPLFDVRFFLKKSVYRLQVKYTDRYLFKFNLLYWQASEKNDNRRKQWNRCAQLIHSFIHWSTLVDQSGVNNETSDTATDFIR